MNALLSTRGFSLIEALISLAILALLSFMAWPPINEHITTSRSDSQIHLIESFFSLGRLSAISENDIVVACPSADHQECGADWRQDWILFADPNRNYERDENEPIIRIHQPELAQFEIKVKPANRGNFRWQPLGITHGAPGSILLCHPHAANANRKITVSMLGRTLLSIDSNHDGIHEERNGKALDCSA